jgi:hypothetical protein
MMFFDVWAHTGIHCATGNVDCMDSVTGKAGCPENLMYPGQSAVQLMLVLLMLVCVPWMLLPKPLILKKRHEARLAAGYTQLDNDDAADGAARKLLSPVRVAAEPTLSERPAQAPSEQPHRTSRCLLPLAAAPQHRLRRPVGSAEHPSPFPSVCREIDEPAYHPNGH